MEQVLIRACTLNDIDAIVQLEREWEREDIAYGDFNPLSREAFIAFLERFPAYFLVAENDGQIDRDLKRHLTALVEERTAHHLYGLYLTVAGTDRAELETRTRALLEACADAQLIVRRCDQQHLDGALTTAPLGRDDLRYLRETDTPTLARLLPSSPGCAPGTTLRLVDDDLQAALATAQPGQVLAWSDLVLLRDAAYPLNDLAQFHADPLGPLASALRGGAAIHYAAYEVILRAVERRWKAPLHEQVARIQAALSPDDLADRLLAALPAACHDRVIVIDVGGGVVPCINPMDPQLLREGIPLATLVGQIEQLFARIDPETWPTSMGMQQFARNGLYAQLEGEATPTLVRLDWLYSSRTYRGTVLTNTRNLHVKKFWESEYPAMDISQTRSIEAFRRRLQRFVGA